VCQSSKKKQEQDCLVVVAVLPATRKHHLALGEPVTPGQLYQPPPRVLVRLVWSVSGFAVVELLLLHLLAAIYYCDDCSSPPLRTTVVADAAEGRLVFTVIVLALVLVVFHCD
jgi:hypothetical protein